jgi:hypothetical protein
MPEGRNSDAVLHRDSYICAYEHLMFIAKPNKRKNVVSIESAILLIRLSGMMPSMQCTSRPIQFAATLLQLFRQMCSCRLPTRLLQACGV